MGRLLGLLPPLTRRAARKYATQTTRGRPSDACRREIKNIMKQLSGGSHNTGQTGGGSQSDVNIDASEDKHLSLVVPRLETPAAKT